VYKKALLADRLRFIERVAGHEYDEATLDVAGVAGTEKLKRILRSPQAYVEGPLRAGSITGGLQSVFGLLALFQLLAVLCVWLLV
jgi:hypothetical protein